MISLEYPTGWKRPMVSSGELQQASWHPKPELVRKRFGIDLRTCVCVGGGGGRGWTRDYLIFAPRRSVRKNAGQMRYYVRYKSHLKDCVHFHKVFPYCVSATGIDYVCLNE